MHRIKFITDSAADIPAALREQYGIEMLSFPIFVEEKEYRDGVDFTPQEFYHMLVSLPSIPTHSQLNVYNYSVCYERALAEGYDALIYTAINAKGSTTCQNAILARDMFFEEHPDARGKLDIRIIDSRTYTMGYGWAVVEGARLAAEGKDVGEVVAAIQDWLDHVRILFVPFDLKFAKKSGRVSAAAAFVGEALGLKPIMTFEDGESKILAKVRGEKNVVPTILKMCKEERQEGTPYLIIRADRPDQSDLLAQAFTEAFGQTPSLDYLIGGVITINAGPNLAGVIYRKK